VSHLLVRGFLGITAKIATTSAQMSNDARPADVVELGIELSSEVQQDLEVGWLYRDIWLLARGALRGTTFNVITALLSKLCNIAPFRPR
jgi:hypothetical protein